MRLRREHRRWIAAVVAIAASLVVGRGVATAWEPRQFESPTGDRAQGIAQAAQGGSDFLLIVGCDGERGDRWRGVTVAQPPGATPGPRLEDPAPGPRPRQRVRIAIGSGAPLDDTFEIGGRPKGPRLYWIPQASDFVAQMLAAEKADAAGDVRLDFRLADGKPLVVRFPLAGFGAAFSDLSKRCRDWQPTIGGAKAG